MRCLFSLLGEPQPTKPLAIHKGCMLYIRLYLETVLISNLPHLQQGTSSRNMPSPRNDEHSDTDGASVSRRRNAVQHAYHGGRGMVHTVQGGGILERPRLMEALEEVDVACIALTADFRGMLNLQRYGVLRGF